MHSQFDKPLLLNFSSLFLTLISLASGCTKTNDGVTLDTSAAATLLPRAPWPTTNVLPAVSPDPLSQQLDQPEVSRLSVQAYAGDPTSAWLLRQYYASIKPLPSEEVRNWELVAAENGDKSAASFYAARLEQLGGEQNCLRSKFWYERALPNPANLNAAENVSIRANLESLAENWQMCLNRATSN